jgi:lysophospholipase L1-like esterase
VRRDGILAKLSLSLVSLVLFFGLIELGARLVWRSENHGGHCASPDPVLINANTPSCEFRDKKTEGELVEFRFNQFAYRDATLVAETERAPLELFAVGDSFTLGAMVPFESTYEQVAQADLRKALGIPVRYVNGGVSSWDLSQYLVRVREAASRGADVITVGVLANDFFADLSEEGLRARAALPGKASMEAAYQELYMARRPWIERLYRAVLSESRALDLAVHLLLSSDDAYALSYLWREGPESYLRRPLPASWKAKLANGERILREMAEVARAANAKLVVIAIPQRIQALLHARADQYLELDAHALFDELARISSELGIPYIDGFAPLYEVERPTSLYYPVDGHLTPEGQERLGHHVATELVRLGVVGAPGASAAARP